MSQYTVTQGDTLWKIVKNRYGLTNNTDIANKINEVVKENNLSNGGNSIFADEKLNLPNTDSIFAGNSSVAQATNNNETANVSQKTSVTQSDSTSSPTSETFTDWTNNEVINSLGADANGEAVFVKEPTPFNLTDAKGKEALSEMNALDENSATPAKMQQIDADVKSTYIADIKKQAQADIDKNYDSDGDHEMTEDEFVNSTTKGLDFSGEPNSTEQMKLAKEEAGFEFALINQDHKPDKDNKQVVTADEYAAYLAANDSNNSTGTFDGEINGDEFKNSDYAIDSNGTISNSQKLFMQRSKGIYNIIKSTETNE